MKAENSPDWNRKIRLTEIPIPESELKGNCPLLTELEITINYTRKENDDQIICKAITLDKYVIPLLMRMINTHPLNREFLVREVTALAERLIAAGDKIALDEVFGDFEMSYLDSMSYEELSEIYTEYIEDGKD